MILLNDTHFDINKVKDKIVGGGVLPIAIKENNEVVILLGKERYINHWRGSLKWSGFEGGRKYNESIEHLAAREFVEESMGVIGLQDNMYHSTIDDVMNIIIDNMYFARIILCINHTQNNVIEQRYHITYVIQVPYQEMCEERFLKIRHTFVDFQTKLIQFKKLVELLPNDFIQEDSIIKGKKIKAITDVAVFNNDLVITYLEEEGTKQIKKEISNKNDTASLYLRWFSFRVQLNNDIKKFELIPNAISIQKNCLGFFVNAQLNEEYIEKQQIKWWNINDLQEVLQNGGFTNQDFFRAYFLPVLQRTVQELQIYNN